jgi:hypothetical protein
MRRVPGLGARRMHASCVRVTSTESKLTLRLAFPTQAKSWLEWATEFF